MAKPEVSSNNNQPLHMHGIHHKHLLNGWLIAISFLILPAVASGQSTLYICDAPPTDSGEFCQEDVFWVQKLDKVTEYDFVYGDSIGFNLEKTLYYIVQSNDFSAAPTATFVLLETINAQENIKVELDRYTMDVDPSWNYIWHKITYTRAGLFWVDVYIGAYLVASGFISVEAPEN